jgi:hypothetical protein
MIDLYHIPMSLRIGTFPRPRLRNYDGAHSMVAPKLGTTSKILEPSSKGNSDGELVSFSTFPYVGGFFKS